MLVDALHNRLAYGRRVRVLGQAVASLLPPESTVLDVGCGDGLLAAGILHRRPGIRIRGLDVLKRRASHIQVDIFDGLTVPYEDDSFDFVYLIDVVHHAQEPVRLLSEAARVSRVAVLVKDHLLEGFLAGTTLRLMDWVGNARHGVALPYNYWSRSAWISIIEQLGLEASVWREDLGIYPWPATLIFDRSLHFLARLEKHTG